MSQDDGLHGTKAGCLGGLSCNPFSLIGQPSDTVVGGMLGNHCRVLLWHESEQDIFLQSTKCGFTVHSCSVLL